MKNFIKHKSLRYCIIGLSTVLLVGIAGVGTYALGRLSEGWRVTSTSTRLNIYSSCKDIAAPIARTIFVPTKTLAEWNSFTAHPPAGTSVADCMCPREYKFTRYIGPSPYGTNATVLSTWGCDPDRITYQCISGSWVEVSRRGSHTCHG